MIFDIVTKNDRTYLVETKMYDAWELYALLERAGFFDWRVCCCGQYENALEFDPVPQW